MTRIGRKRMKQTNTQIKAIERKKHDSNQFKYDLNFFSISLILLLFSLPVDTYIRKIDHFGTVMSMIIFRIGISNTNNATIQFRRPNNGRTGKYNE